MRRPGNMFRRMVIDPFAVCAVAPSCWNRTLAQEKNANHLIPPPLNPPTEYYPFKRCQVPMGHPVRIYSNVNVFVSQKRGETVICITIWTSGHMTCMLLKVFISIYTKKNRSSNEDMIIFRNFIFKLQTKSWNCAWFQTSVMVYVRFLLLWVVNGL